MLSPVLLDCLRTWWRTARANGWMLNGGWLFPGQDPADPISPSFPSPENDKGAIGRLYRLRIYYQLYCKKLRIYSAGYEFILAKHAIQDFIVLFKTLLSRNNNNTYQPDSRSGVAVILWMLKSAPLNSSSASRRMPTNFFSTP